MKLYSILFLSSLCSTASGFSSTVALTGTSSYERTALLDLLPESGVSFIGGGSAQAKSICEACEALEKTSTSPFSASASDLEGTWKLRFTSASPYGLLPLDALPEVLRKSFIDDSLLLASAITQTVDATESRIVNRVDLAPWPKQENTFLSAVAAPLGLAGLQQAIIHLELDHSFETNGAALDLKLETIRRSLQTDEELPAFIPKETSYNLPLPPSGSFETVYLDSSLRIDRSKGPLGEVVVMERESVGVGAQAMAEMGLDTNECEITYEEDGITPVILCEPSEDLGEAPSD